MRVPMIATRDLTYATRRLKAGDAFEAVSSNDARVLRAIKKADHAPDPADDISHLRSVYQEKFGKRAFNGWDADTLKEKIANAQVEG